MGIVWYLIIMLVLFAVGMLIHPSIITFLVIAVFGGMWHVTMNMMHGYVLWDSQGMGGHEVTNSDVFLSLLGTIIQICIIVWIFT